MYVRSTLCYLTYLDYEEHQTLLIPLLSVPCLSGPHARALVCACGGCSSESSLCPLTSQIPSDVDFRVMLVFVEFYETLLEFVNFKLYNSLNLKYPPQVCSLSCAPYVSACTACACTVTASLHLSPSTVHLLTA